MPTLQETLDEFHWPGFENLLTGMQEGVEKAIPNPMRSLENASNPMEHIARALEIAGTPINALAGAGLGAFEQFTSPASRKELEKSTLAAFPAMSGAAGGRIPSLREGKAGMKLATEGNPGGWVRAAPEMAESTNQALGGMDARVRDKILRSSREYRVLPVTKEGIRQAWGDRAKSVGGWNQSIEITNPKKGNVSYLSTTDPDPNWISPAIAHELDHGLGKEIGVRDLSGINYTPEYRQKLLDSGYAKSDLNSELFADVLAGQGRRNYAKYDVADATSLEDLLNNLNPEKNNPLFVVDHSMTSDPTKYRPTKGTQYFENFQQDEAKKAFWEKKNRAKALEKEKQGQDAFWQKIEAAKDPKPTPRGPQPEGELAELLSHLGSSPKVKTDLSKGGTLGEADRPWNIPGAEQSGIYDAMNPGKKKYGGSYAPNAAKTFEMEGSNLRDLKAQPISANDMPSEVADYVMRKFTAMHEDTPIVKEQKRGQITKFMDWWQSASDDDRRMYSKMIKTTAEKPAPPQAPSAPRYQEMPTRGGIDKKKLQNERLRLMNVHGLRKK